MKQLDVTITGMYPDWLFILEISPEFEKLREFITSFHKDYLMGESVQQKIVTENSPDFNLDNIEYKFYNHLPLDDFIKSFERDYSEYKKKYPYSTKEEFINDVTLDLNNSKIQYKHETSEVSLPKELNNEKYKVLFIQEVRDIIYHPYNNAEIEIYDYSFIIIEQQYDLKFFKQYFRKIENYIKDFLNNENDEKGNSTPKNKNKPDTNKLTENQKSVIAELVDSGFLDSHIYRYLKDEKTFIDLTELEFISFMNKEHKKKYKSNKRFTPLSNLTFPVELKKRYEELTT